MDATNPLHFAHYEVRRREDGSPWELGRGAMGVTYKAYDAQLRVEVALKVITPGQVDDAKAQALFLREARAAARVRHPNVASVVYLNTTPGNFFYAMEFIAGESLQDLLKTRSTLPPVVAIGFATQIARGLGAIHEQHIVHRDLKPANLMIVAAGHENAPAAADSNPEAWQVKIIDFGLARGFAGEGLGTEVSAQTIGFRGTALYASPEQCEEHGQIDGRSDLYSLGCILWEMLVGAPPFRARTHRELLNQHVSQPPPLQQLSHLPMSVQAVMARLMVKDRDARFGDAGAVIKAFEKCRERIEHGEGKDKLPDADVREGEQPTMHLAQQQAGDRSTPTPVPDAPRQRQLVAAGLVVVALGTAVVINGVASGWGRGPSATGAAREKGTTLPTAPPVAPTLAATSTLLAVTPAADANSVAVLAFNNLSSDKEQEYFSDGISEELLNVLSKVPGLKVSARTSAFSFKGKNVAIPEIAKQLGVAYVVEGSVRKSGDKVRITAQLIKASDGFHVWSDSFDRELKDVFAVQAEIAGLIAKHFQIKIGASTVAMKLVDPEAFRLLLAGRAKVRAAGIANRDAAIEDFRLALAIAPDYAAAWAELARALIRQSRVSASETLQDTFREARAAANRAATLDPDAPEVLLALGWVRRTADWDWRGSEQAFRRALALHPNYPDIVAGSALLFSNLGYADESLDLARRAVGLDPLNADAYYDLGLVLWSLNRWTEMEAALRKAVALAPTAEQYHAVLAFALLGMGQYEEAEREAAREPEALWRSMIQALILAHRGKTTEALALARELESSFNHNEDVAEIYALVSKRDLAFAALERGYALHETSMPYVKVDIYLRNLHDDPRWPVFLRKMGLADDQLK